MKHINYHSSLWLFIATYFVFSVFSFEAKSQINYITSGYYQMIYKAEWAYLNEKYDSAFLYYQKAAQTAPILNQSQYCEQEKYASLLIKRGLYQQGFVQLADLIQHNRTTFVDFCAMYLSNVDTSTFSKYPQWKQLHSIIPDKTDSSMIAILRVIYDNEQSWQDILKERRKNPESIDTNLLRNKSMVHDENFQLLYALLCKGHFPMVDDVGFEHIELINILGTVGMHIAKYRDYLDKIVFANVEQGYCSPQFYACLYDRAGLDLSPYYKTWSLYATYSSTTEDSIFDIKNLDQRRLQIGLPTWEYQRKMQEFWMEKFRKMGVQMQDDK